MMFRKLQETNHLWSVEISVDHGTWQLMAMAVSEKAADSIVAALNFVVEADAENTLAELVEMVNKQ